MKDIPEIVDWVAQSPKMQDIIQGVDPEILSSMKIPGSFNTLP